MHKPWIRDLPRYVPGVAPKVGEEGKLSSNESVLAPPDRVLRAVLDAARRLNRYPDPLASGLREVLARKMGLSEDAILVGNGSDELIYLLAMAYLGPGSKVVVADPPYLMDEIASRALGPEVVRVPLDGYRHDLNAMAEVEADVAFIPNPHNPTGTAVPLAEFERFLDTSGAELVIVDEAYVDFADDPRGMSSLRLIKATGRVVVLRTLSKLYGLAGARVGYMMAPPEIVETLRKIRAPFSVNALAQAAAEAVLSDEGYAEKTRLLVRESRDRSCLRAGRVPRGPFAVQLRARKGIGREGTPPKAGERRHRGKARLRAKYCRARTGLGCPPQGNRAFGRCTLGMKTRETSPRASLLGKGRRSGVSGQTAAFASSRCISSFISLTQIFSSSYSVIQNCGKGRGVVAKTSLPEGRCG